MRQLGYLVLILRRHVWVWWVSRSQELPERVEEALQESLARNAIYVSSISAWEVALLVRGGRLELTIDVPEWIAMSEGLPFIHFVPVDNRIALRSIQLPHPLHRDPADRMIISTALCLGATLVTADEELPGYSSRRHALVAASPLRRPSGAQRGEEEARNGGTMSVAMALRSRRARTHTASERQDRNLRTELPTLFLKSP